MGWPLRQAHVLGGGVAHHEILSARSVVYVRTKAVEQVADPRAGTRDNHGFASHPTTV
jgi:hypothetical protein